MKDEFGLDAQLLTGAPGVFEVAVNGRPVVKKAGLAFPTEQETVDAVARALGR